MNSINVMRCLKRHRSTSSHPLSRNSKDICPRCTRNVKFTKGRHNSGVLSYYKNLCKSSKCLIHGKNYSPKIKKTAMDLNKIRTAPQKLLGKGKVTQCTVDEFEDDVYSTGDIDLAMFEKIEATVENFDPSTETFFATSVGYRLIKEVINKTIIWPLKKPEIFKGLRTAPKGVLLFGPPGTGKTFLGKYIASETNSTFFNISASTLTSKWMGDSEKLVRTAFLVAKARQPSVIFVDEIDSILSKRFPDENGSTRRMKNEFLVCMDGINSELEEKVMVIAATSRPHELDEGARHRFFKRLYLPLPDKTDRREILLKFLEQECYSLEEIDISDIVRKTEGYSIADLKNLCQEAAMGPIKLLAGSAIIWLKPDKIRPISIEDFMCALQLIKPTVSREQVQICEEWDSMYGYGGDESTIKN